MYPLFDMINICGAEYLFEIVQEFHVDKFHIKGFHIERKKTIENVMDTFEYIVKYFSILLYFFNFYA
jgi:hypothetical protein